MGYETWESKLQKVCLSRGYPSPVFQIVSDRRGGRTAWSSVVLVNGRPHSARFWYDGKNLQNARNDAAEVAYKILNPLTPISPATSRSSGW